MDAALIALIGTAILSGLIYTFLRGRTSRRHHGRSRSRLSSG